MEARCFIGICKKKTFKGKGFKMNKNYLRGLTRPNAIRYFLRNSFNMTKCEYFGWLDWIDKNIKRKE